MTRTILRAGIVTLALCAASMANSAPPASGNPPAAVAATLQSDELPPGPNFSLYKASCLTCHTSSYVIKSPKSPRQFWETEVKKMADLYDAPIQAGDQKRTGRL